MLFSIVLIVSCALVLMALEAFIPGVSLAGIAGFILFGVAGYLCWDAYGTAMAALLLLLCVLASFFIMRLVFRSMKNGKLSKSGMFLNEPVAPAIKTAPHEQKIAAGSIGTANSALHPAGIAEFDGVRIHVVSDNGFVEKNEKLVIVRMEGARVVVRRMEE